MCGCTLYDSPTCGHSWVSMSQPCGYLSDLLSCPYRTTIQTLIAPPYTCPTCNAGFADHETVEMVQGPWGCNQMLRNHIGGPHALGGQWGNWGGPALIHGGGAGMGMGMLMNGYQQDHRIAGPYGGNMIGVGSPCGLTNHSMIANPSMSSMPMICDGCDDGYDDMYYGDMYYGGKSKKSKSKHKYKYRYSDKPSTDCTIM